MLCFYVFQELDGLAVGRRSVEMEKGTLMERLEASKRVIEAARRESHCLEKQAEELERKLQTSQGETQAAEEKLQMLLKKVADVLQGKSESVILPTEKDVLNQVDVLCNKVGKNMCIYQHQQLAKMSRKISAWWIRANIEIILLKKCPYVQ